MKDSQARVLATVILPLPPRPLHPNGGHGDRRMIWRLKKESRDLAARHAKLLVAPSLDAPIEAAAILAVWTMWSKRGAKAHDPDNLIAWLKSYLDGLQDGGVLANDDQLIFLPPRQRRLAPATVRQNVTMYFLDATPIRAFLDAAVQLVEE